MSDSTPGDEPAEIQPAQTEDNKPRARRNWPGEFVVSLDLRSLALLRWCYGFILFCDTVVRWTDIRAHYSDFGVLPRDQLLALGWNENWFSLHMASGSLRWLHLLFLLQVVCALALLVGWQTRWNTFLSWLLLISVHSRNPMVLNGGDIYLRVILFWMLFLPWGHRWSLDARQGRSDHRFWMPDIRGDAVKGFAPLAVTIQIASVYWFAAIPKTDPSWVADYTATSLALRLDQFLTPAGLFLREHFAGQLGLLTMGVIFWEAYGPFFLFFPFDRGQVRTLGILGIMAMHLGFGTSFELGFFAWIGCCSPLVLLPAWVWNVPLKKLSALADSRLGAMPDKSSNRWLTLPRETLYFLIIAYCFLWNMQNENARPLNLRLPPRLLWIGNALRIDQRWNMFSPGPLTEDGWFVIDGHFKDGTEADLFAGGKPVTWEKPLDVVHTYKNQRWRKYMMNLWLADNQRYRLPYGQYICRLWNAGGRGPHELSTFELVYMLERTNMDSTEAKPEKTVIWTHWCFEQPPKSEGPKKEVKLPTVRPLKGQ